MKCPKCKFYNICKGRLNETVEHCVRFKSAEQTNEEWLRSCNTEQLAEFINDVSKKCYTCGEGYTAHPAYCPLHKCLRGSVYGITEWLKQPHREENEK